MGIVDLLISFYYYPVTISIGIIMSMQIQYFRLSYDPDNILLLISYVLSWMLIIALLKKEKMATVGLILLSIGINIAHLIMTTNIITNAILCYYSLILAFGFGHYKKKKPSQARIQIE